MKKLRALGEEDAAADAIQAGGATTLGMLKIIGIERTEIRRDAKVFRVGVHGAKYSQQRAGEHVAEGWSERNNLAGLREMSFAA